MPLRRQVCTGPQETLLLLRTELEQEVLEEDQGTLEEIFLVVSEEMEEGILPPEGLTAVGMILQALPLQTVLLLTEVLLADLRMEPFREEPLATRAEEVAQAEA